MGHEIKLFQVRMEPLASQRVAEVLASGYIGQGERCAEFERAFGAFIGAPAPPLLVNSCTSAIDLALHLSGVGPGMRSSPRPSPARRPTRPRRSGVRGWCGPTWTR